MNLALYIYLCDVVGNVAGLLTTAAVILGMVNIGIPLFCLGHADFDTYKRGEELEEAKSVRSRMMGLFGKLIVALICVVMARAITPSKNTMYAMAAAYYGEQAVKSETFKKLNSKAMQLLEVKIDELIGEPKK